MFSALFGRKQVAKQQVSLSLAHIFKFNPYHEPGGSAKGGQFAKKPGGATTINAKDIEERAKEAGKFGVLGKDANIAEWSKKFDDPDATEDSILSKLDQKDAAEIKDKTIRAKGEPASYDLFSDNGVFTPDRLALHEKIIEHFINEKSLKAATPEEGQAPTFIVLGGRGGSGKSSFTNGTIKEFDSKKFIKLDSDEIKEWLRPPYEGWNAFCVHKESAMLMDALTDRLIQKRVNFIHDATMKSKNVERDINRMKGQGYNVEGHYMYVPRQTSALRAQQRYLGQDGKRGRLVPAQVILDEMKNNEAVFDDLKKHFSKWSAYDNQGERPVLLAKGGAQ